MAKLIINPTDFTDVKFIEPNRFEAKCDGIPLSFERVIVGWTVDLRIEVNGRCIHSDNGADERAAWDVLHRLACEAVDIEDNLTRADNKFVCEKLFKKVNKSL